jgi:DNA-binding SARP family transcriptional activator
VIFNILGPLEILDRGRPVDLGRHLQRAVVAILLLSPNRVVPVDRLVSDLWGDEAPKHPVEAIHVYISRLRRALEPNHQPRTPGEVLVRSPPGYLLRVPPGQLDADRFDSLVSRGRQLLADGDAEQASHVLADGLGLWRGPVLAEFIDSGFARPTAKRLEELHRVAVEQRLEAELALGHHASAAGELEELVDRDPLRERAWELLALALYRGDRQAEALRALTRARVALAETLGLEPCPSLRRLEQAILTHAPELAWHFPGPPPDAVGSPGEARRVGGSRGGESRLVGRRQEMACLRAALADSVLGKGGIVVVSGEPGIGKTRLIEELAHHAAAIGVTTAIASGHDGEGAPPFWPWVQIVRTLVSHGEPNVVRAALAHRASAMAPVVAEVLDVVADAPRPVTADAETRRVHFYDAVVGFVRQLAESGPLLIILEDLHWDDVASLELTQLLASQLDDSRLLVVGTHRDVGLAADHPLVNLLSVTARLPHAQSLELPGLSLTEVGEILAQGIGHQPERSLVSAVYEKTAGNPFFVTELSRLLTGEAVAGDGVTGVIPHRVRAVIRRRMARLDESTREALALASIVGAEFNFGLLARTGNQNRETLLYAMESALVAGLIVESSDAPGRYRFSHSILRDTIYESISALRRARHHARIAEALTTESSGDPDNTMAIAYHYYQAAPAIGPDLGIAYLLRAAEMADARLAYEQAEEYLQRAQRLIGTMTDGVPRASQELSVQNRIAISATLISGFADPRVDKAWTKAAELASRTAESANLAASLWGAAALALSRGQLGILEEIGNRLLAAHTDSGAPSLSVAGHLALGMSSFHRGRLADAVVHLEIARRGCASLGDQSVSVFIIEPEVYALGYLAWARWLMGDVEQSARLSTESIACASKSVQAFSLTAALTLDALFAATRLDAEAANQRAERIIAADRSHDGALLAELIAIWARADQGEEDVGSRIFEESQKRMAESGWKLFGPLFLGLRARLHRQERSPADALAAIDEALVEVDASDQRFFEAELLRHRAELLAICHPDQTAEVSNCLSRALRVAREQGAQAFVFRAEALQAMAQTNLGLEGTDQG